MILSFHDRCAIRSQSTHSGRLSDSVELFARLINSNGWRFREKTLKGIASLHELYKTAANYRLNEETSGFSVWYKIAHGPLFVIQINNSLRWRHNGRDSVSNHQPHHCLLNRLFRRRSKKTSKLRVTGLCGEFTGDRWIHRTNGQ